MQVKLLCLMLLSTSCFARRTTLQSEATFQETYIAEQKSTFDEVFALLSSSPYEDDGQIILFLSPSNNRLDVFARAEKKPAKKIELTPKQAQDFADHFRAGIKLETYEHKSFGGVTYQLRWDAKDRDQPTLTEWNNPEDAKASAQVDWIKKLKNKIKEL